MSRVGILGWSRYADSLAVQKYHSLIGAFILTEHYLFFTIGVWTENYNLEDEEKLKALGTELYANWGAKYNRKRI